jgi:hypothetical protein
LISSESRETYVKSYNSLFKNYPGTFQLNLNYKDFLAENNLIEHDVPENGLCFLHSLVDFFRFLYNTNVNILELRNQVEAFFLTKNEKTGLMVNSHIANEIMMQLGISDENFFLNGIHLFFDRAIYDHEFVDILINLAPERTRCTKSENNFLKDTAVFDGDYKSACFAESESLFT